MRSAPTGRRPLGTCRGLKAAAAILLACSLAACGPTGTGLQRDAARQLQERVLSVSQAAAANDPAGGLAALDRLEADLAAAVGEGQVSEDRRRSIMTAVAAVRADLTQAKTLADAAAAEAAKAAEEAAAAQQQADVTAAQNTQPAPVAPSPSEGKGNDDDKGNDEGNGKGKNDG